MNPVSLLLSEANLAKPCSAKRCPTPVILNDVEKLAKKTRLGSRVQGLEFIKSEKYHLQVQTIVLGGSDQSAS